MSQIIDIIDDAGIIPAVIRWLVEKIKELKHRIGLSENSLDQHEIRVRLSQLEELLRWLRELRPEFANVSTTTLANII